MNSIAINTSQNVNLDFAVASIGERIAAFFVDMAIKISYAVLLLLLLTQIFDLGSLLNSMDQWSIMAFYGIIMLPIELYTLVFETLMEGQTPGKRMMKIKVVKIDGYQASFGDYLIRWFFRLVDVLLSSGVIGLLTMIFNPYNQRLGGIASGTAVISLKNRTYINHTILKNLAEDYQPKFQQVLSLTDRDMQIIVTQFQKANRMAEYDIIQKLAAKIREITKIPDQKGSMSDKEFVETVIADFNYYTGKT